VVAESVVVAAEQNAVFQARQRLPHPQHATGMV